MRAPALANLKLTACLCIGVNSACACKSCAVSVRRSVLLRPRWSCRSGALPSPRPRSTPVPPIPPRGRRLTLAGPDREWAWRGIHGAPRQPTEPTHSVCAGVPTPGHTHNPSVFSVKFSPLCLVLRPSSISFLLVACVFWLQRFLPLLLVLSVCLTNQPV